MMMFSITVKTLYLVIKCNDTNNTFNAEQIEQMVAEPSVKSSYE